MFLDESEFDIIVAGGGTCGCIIAGRLAAADASLKILVMEAGPPTRDRLIHTQPARYLSHLLPDSTTVKFYVGQESKDLGGRAPVVPCGQCLGGGSSVNFAMYTRAAASDYDDWETVHGNLGWGSKDLIPFLRKSETYQVQPEKVTHGYSGPLKVSYGGAFTNIGKEFLDVAAQYDKDRGMTDDANGLLECNVYGRWQKWIDADTGKRSDVPHYYVYNQDHNKNLHVVTGYLVKRIIFEGKRAVGVEYVPNSRFHPTAKHKVRVARARRLVVVSAGAFGSPAILERSGIGGSLVLRNNNITAVVDLPGVGENYQDHQATFAPYLASDEAETLDGIIRGDEDEIEKWSSEWDKTGSGLMAHNGMDAGIRIRPSAEELEALGPDFQQVWMERFAHAPDKPVMWLGPLALLVGDPSAVPARKYFSMGDYIDYPLSIGHVHITSAEDVDAAPDFNPGYLSRIEDLSVLRWGYKRGREFARRMPSYRGECLPLHPMFPDGSEVLCHAEVHPIGIHEPDLKYTPEDDKALDDHIRKVVATAWHSLGTCAMKARDRNGVVDARLNVYGVECLKVADMSIAPSNVSANTYSTAVVIAEKAVTIIMEELKDLDKL
ncbi:hypothetical protein AcW1_002232 [Taiwanofungus camphoratus]|nr:hypothetical protein AcV5_010226 [Antrodia cinnamomea]KAI0944551.1 hypothetical protein AcW1_002232 [Antrodia cinnamomea]